MKTGERITLKKALKKENGFEAELRLEKVALSDKIEYTVFAQRLVPDTNYMKTFIWTDDLALAEDTFNDVIQKSEAPKYQVA